MAVLQMVAVPFPPFLTPPGHPGGEGRGGEGEIQTANQYSSPETQPLARRVGWGLEEGWRGLEVGWLGSGEGWLGSGRRVGWGLEEGWLGSKDPQSFLFLLIFGHSFAYVAHFVLLRNVWIRTPRDNVNRSNSVARKICLSISYRYRYFYSHFFLLKHDQ